MSHGTTRARVWTVHTHFSPVQSLTKAVPKPGARQLCILRQEPSGTDFPAQRPHQAPSATADKRTLIGASKSAGEA